MGCYGIGISRVMGVIAEKNNDERGLVWPETVAPAKVYLITLGEAKEAADKLYAELVEAGIDVIYDDRAVSAGNKFADADLIGCPLRVTVSPKTLAEDSFELKYRPREETKLLKLSQALEHLR
jgi:prolyl-tRNA synthetase